MSEGGPTLREAQGLRWANVRVTEQLHLEFIALRERLVLYVYPLIFPEGKVLCMEIGGYSLRSKFELRRLGYWKRKIENICSTRHRGTPTPKRNSAQRHTRLTLERNYLANEFYQRSVTSRHGIIHIHTRAHTRTRFTYTPRRTPRTISKKFKKKLSTNYILVILFRTTLSHSVAIFISKDDTWDVRLKTLQMSDIDCPEQNRFKRGKNSRYCRFTRRHVQWINTWMYLTVFTVIRSCRHRDLTEMYLPDTNLLGPFKWEPPGWMGRQLRGIEASLPYKVLRRVK